MGKPQYLHLTPGPKRTRAEGSELRLLRCGLRSLAEVELRAPENQRFTERVVWGENEGIVVMNIWPSLSWKYFEH